MAQPNNESPVIEEKGTPDTSPDKEKVENVDEAKECLENLGEDHVEDGGWWGSWITAAKSKSVEVLGMVKKDLDELGTAVKSEASFVYNSTSSAIEKTLKLNEPESTANTMKKSLSTFLDQVSTVLNPAPDDEDTEAYLVTDGDLVNLSSFQKELLQLQRLDATYLVCPEDAALARMTAWLETCPLPSSTAIQKQFRSSSILQEKFKRLVPHAVSEHDFWERYLFRKALLEDKLAQSKSGFPDVCSDTVVNSLGTDLESPTHSSQSSGDSLRSNYGSSKSRSLDISDGNATPSEEVIDESAVLDEDVTWENEDFASNIELSEEQQIKLLQEYEEEIKNAKQTKKKPSASSPTKTGAIHKNKNHNDKKSSRNQSETKSNSSKRSINDTRSRSSDAISSMQHTMTKGKTHQSMGALAKKQKSGTEKKVPKQDIQSMIVEDHFIEEKVVKTEPKTVSLSEELKEKNISQAADNASSNSDESWEKDFEIENLNINAS